MDSRELELIAKSIGQSVAEGKPSTAPIGNVGAEAYAITARTLRRLGVGKGAIEPLALIADEAAEELHRTLEPTARRLNPTPKT